VRKVAFLVLPEYSNLGLAAATEPLFVANWLAQRTVFDWRVISVDGAPVRASNGRSTAVDGALDAAADAKTVFVLASFDSQHALAKPQAMRWLKRMARFGVEIGGIENGSVVLAAAGLLNDRPVAVHWDNIVGFQEQFPTTQPMTQLFVRQRERITCAGAAAILDMMVAWIGWHADRELAAEVADHLLLGKPRPGETVQRGGGVARESSDAATTLARAIMSQHIEEPLSCGEIARRVGLSLRQLERRFKDQLGTSVLQQYRRIRIAKAHQLLQQTALSVTEVAFSCGFVSPEYFCRLYRSHFGCSPSSDRRQSTTAPVMRRTADAAR